MTQAAAARTLGFRSLLLLLLPWTLPAWSAERIGLAVVRADGVIVNFTVELAETDSARRLGLMGRARLAPRTGMLFDFGAEQPIAMWMKNTLIPLDMLFAAADGRIIDLHRDAVPESEEVLFPRHHARYVLELNAGEAREFAIEPGDRLLLH